MLTFRKKPEVVVFLLLFIMGGCITFGNGMILVSGVVVDDDGQPLSDVNMLISSSRNTWNPLQGSHADRTKVVSGVFRYRCWCCSSIYIYFYKEGYHHEELSFVFEREVDGNMHGATKLRVQLDRMRNPVTLVNLRGELSAGAGILKVLPISPRPTSSTVDLKYLEAKTTDGGKLAYLRLEVELEADGTVAMVPLKRPNASPSFMRPRSAYLDFSAANGGAVLYETTEKEIWRIYDSMREAPESGYVAHLSLDPAREETYYFYCKLGEFYGKGEIHPPRILRSSGPQGVARAVAYVNIWLNTDGGRSVESRYH